MNDCSFCDKGVHPFYEVDTHKGKQHICHTCFHTGKHKQAQVVAAPAQTPASQSTKAPTAPEKSTSKR